MSKIAQARRMAGFTALEVSVTLAVVGLGTLVAAPAFTTFLGSNRLVSAADEMAGRLRLARSRAVAEETPYICFWNPSTEQYFVVRDVNGNSLPDDGEPAEGPYGVPGGINLQQLLGNPFPSNRVVFLPSGSSNTSGAVVLTNERGHSRTVSVIQSTGAVEVE